MRKVYCIVHSTLHTAHCTTHAFGHSVSAQQGSVTIYVSHPGVWFHYRLSLRTVTVHCHCTPYTVTVNYPSTLSLYTVRVLSRYTVDSTREVYTITIHCHCTLSLYIVTAHCHSKLPLYPVHCTLYPYSSTVQCYDTLPLTMSLYTHSTLSLYTVIVHCYCTLGVTFPGGGVEANLTASLPSFRVSCPPPPPQVKANTERTAATTLKAATAIRPAHIEKATTRSTQSLHKYNHSPSPT